MTLPAATLSVPASSDLAVGTWTLPSGSTQQAFKVGIYRSSDIIDWSPTHWPVGGTRPSYIPYALLGERLDWEWSSDTRFEASNIPPSYRLLSPGDYIMLLWWRGTRTGHGLPDDISRPARRAFTITGNASVPDVPRVGIQGRIYLLPAPRIINPNEGATLSGNTVWVDWEARNLHQPTYVKAAVYPAGTIDEDGQASVRAIVGTDNGDDYWETAEWVKTEEACTRLSGGAAGNQRYRLLFGGDNIGVSGGLPNGDFIVRLRYAHSPTGNQSYADQATFRVTNSDNEAPLVVPYVPTPGSNKPLVVPPSGVLAANINEALNLEWTFLSPTGRTARQVCIRRTFATRTGTGPGSQLVTYWNPGLGWRNYTTNVLSAANRFSLPADPSSYSNGWGNTAWAESSGNRRLIRFAVMVIDEGNNASDWSSDFVIQAYDNLKPSGLEITAFPLAVRSRYPGSGFVRVRVRTSADGYSDVRDSGNEPAQVKVGWYHPANIVDGVPTVPPFAYTSDYADPLTGRFDDPMAGDTEGRGAEWVHADTSLSSGNGSYVTTNGLRFGNDIHLGGDGSVESLTYGEIGQNLYTVRARILDRYGNPSDVVSQDFQMPGTVALPHPVTPVPRVYDRNDVVQAGTEGLIDGAYIGVSLTEDTSNAALGDVTYVIVERIEVSRPDDQQVAADEVVVSGKIFPRSDGTFPMFRDYSVASRVAYEYRAVAFRPPGVFSVSDWVPA